MSYTILKSDGTVLTTIVDGTADNTTSLTLPGPNFVGYGYNLDENLVHLLENFASNTPPLGNNLQGQLWFNKSNQTLNVFTTQGYQPVSGIILDSTQPLTVSTGTIWFNTSSNQLYIYDGSNFNLIGPQYTKAEGVGGAIPAIVNDGSTTGLTHNILKLEFGGLVLAIFSSDTQFVPSPAISGFPIIYPGITINNNLFPGSNQFYTNSNAAAYIPTDPTILSIDSNISALSSQVSTDVANINSNLIIANVGMLSYVNDQISTLDTNLSLTISAIYANALSYTDTSVANVKTFLTANISSLISAQADTNSNVSAVNTVLNNLITNTTANAIAQETEISNLNTFVINGLASTNSNIISANTAVVSYVNSQISLINSNAITIQNNLNAANINLSGQIATLANTITQAVAPLAPINSPSFTGSPVAPTPVTSDNSTKIATTAFVKNNLLNYAPIVSPAFTGNPTVNGLPLSIPSIYMIAAAVSDTSSKSMTVTLTPGTWQLIVEPIFEIPDPGNYGFTNSQTATASGHSVTAQVTLVRSGGSGFGRNIYGTQIDATTFVVSSVVTTQLTLGSPVINGGNYYGGKAILSKIA